MDIWDVIDFFYPRRRRYHRGPVSEFFNSVTIIALAIILVIALLFIRAQHVNQKTEAPLLYSTAAWDAKDKNTYRHEVHLGIERIRVSGQIFEIEQGWIEAGIDYVKTSPLTMRSQVAESLVLNIRSSGLDLARLYHSKGIGLKLQGQQPIVIMGKNCSLYRFNCSAATIGKMQTEGLDIEISLDGKTIGNFTARITEHPKV